MPHGEPVPIYLHFCLFADDMDMAVLLYGFASRRAYELGRVSRVLISRVAVSGGDSVARVVYESNPAKIYDQDLIGWPSGKIICRACGGRGEEDCPVCSGTGNIGEV